MENTLEYMYLIPFISHPELGKNIQNSKKNHTHKKNRDKQELLLGTEYTDRHDYDFYDFLFKNYWILSFVSQIQENFFSFCFKLPMNYSNLENIAVICEQKWNIYVSFPALTLPEFGNP